MKYHQNNPNYLGVTKLIGIKCHGHYITCKFNGGKEIEK